VYISTFDDPAGCQ